MGFAPAARVLDAFIRDHLAGGFAPGADLIIRDYQAGLDSSAIAAKYLPAFDRFEGRYIVEMILDAYEKGRGGE